MFEPRREEASLTPSGRTRLWGQEGRDPPPLIPGARAAARLRGTYWGPSARRRWGSPPAGEGRGSPGRPGGPGSGRTGQWSKPWLRGACLGRSPPPPHHALLLRLPAATSAEPEQRRTRRGGATTPEVIGALGPPCRPAQAHRDPEAASRDPRRPERPTCKWSFPADRPPPCACPGNQARRSLSGF